MKFCLRTVFFLAVFGCIVPLRAQDAFVDAMRKCADPSREPDRRIQSCLTAVNAQGVDADETAFAYIDLADAYQSSNQDQLAIQSLDKAVALEPNAWQALANRALLHLKSGEIDAALSDYNKAVAIDPNKLLMFRTDRRPTYRTSDLTAGPPELAQEQAEHDRLVSNLEKAVANGFFGRCQERARGRDLAAALADCNQALQLDPGNPNGLYGRCAIKVFMQAFSSALSDCDAALAASDRKQPAWLYLRAVIKGKLGDRSGAQADAAAANQLLPGIGAQFTAQGLVP